MSKDEYVGRRSMLKAAGLSLAGAAVGATGTAAFNKTPQKPLQGKVALVTGAARGIGLACATRLAVNGANVVICDICEQIDTVPYPLSTTENLNAAEKKIKALGVECLALKVDIRNIAGLQEVVEQVEEVFGRLDILVANAGIAITAPFENAMDTSWNDVLHVNLIGTANTIRQALPLMKRSESGRIVCIASQLARKGSAQASAYVASKWGMVGMAKSLALELGTSSITCNVVCPTATDTGMLNNDVMLSKMSPDDPTIEAFSEKLKASNPIPQGVLSPETVADMVELLCRPESAHLSGTVLDVASNEAARGAY